MNTKKSLLEAIGDYNWDASTQFHIPSHSGRYLDPCFEKITQDLGFMKIDGAFYQRLHVEHMENKHGRIIDFGKPYHNFFNSKMTLYTQNGSTMGNQVMCMCLAKKKVAIQVNSHMSVYNGLLLAGCEIIFISPDCNSEFDIYLPVTAQHIEDVKRDHPDVYAFYLTSPSYEGFVIDYESIKKSCGDALLLIDEAHGAYCYASKQMIQGSLQGGADSSVTSLHKSLGGISGLGMINIGKDSRIDENVVKRSYMLINTTSTSPYFMLNAERCVFSSTENQKEAQITTIVNLNTDFRQKLKQIKNIQLDSLEEQDYKILPNKTLFKVKGMGGQEIFERLLEKDIRIEKYTLTAVLVTVGLLNNQNDIDRLVEEIKILGQEADQNGKVNGKVENKFKDQQFLLKSLFSQRKIVRDIRDVFGSEKKLVKPIEAVGKISGDMVCTCPPGFPVLIYGEEITEFHLEFIQKEERILVITE